MGLCVQEIYWEAHLEDQGKGAGGGWESFDCSTGLASVKGDGKGRKTEAEKTQMTAQF